MRRLFLAGFAALVLSACAGAPASKGPQMYIGEWEWGFETSSFRTDEGEGPWWLSAEGSAWDQIVAPLQRSGGGPWGRVRLSVEGALSPPGQYGHLGAYAHELRVTRVISAELVAASPPPSGS